MNLKVRIIFLAIALFIIIYNSKRSYYNKKVDFYNENINGVIIKIKETRGTKVYYGENEYFFLEAYKGVQLKEGDSISKSNQDIKIYRKSSINKKY